jgi:hypothetical protein
MAGTLDSSTVRRPGGPAGAYRRGRVAVRRQSVIWMIVPSVKALIGGRGRGYSHGHLHLNRTTAVIR